MFRQSTKIPHSSSRAEQYVQDLLNDGLKNVQGHNDFSQEKFVNDMTNKMQGFKTFTLDEIKKHPQYIGIVALENSQPLIIGSGPILDTYKGLHEHLKKKDTLHSWPEGYYPELNGSKYDLNGNIAFVYAGIVKRKTFQLITPLDLLLQRAANEFYLSDLGGAFAELVWLLNNGYSLEVNKAGKLLAKPSYKECSLILPTMTQKFFHVDEAITQMEKIANIWIKFSDEEVKRVSNHWASELISNKEYVSDKNKEKKDYQLQLTNAEQGLSAKHLEY